MADEGYTPTKFIIEITDPADVELYTHALGFSLAIFDMETKIREILKWREGLDEKAYALVEEIRDTLIASKDRYHLPE